MKRNLPNVDREIPVPPEEILVSRTDTRGVITYVNGAFAEISGYTAAELLGSSHNIVRHPEVPPAIFQDLWDTLKRGEPWRGIVKNRAKSGGYYWVDALVCPTFHGSEIVGYVSVRRRADPDRIAAAQRLYAGVAGGRPVRPWWRRHGLDRLASIRGGIALGILAVSLIFLLGAAYSVRAIDRAQAAFEAMYRQQLEGAGNLRRIKFLMGENRSQVLLALLHDPANPISSQHDHPLESHLRNIALNRDEIERLWARFQGLVMHEEQRLLADTYWRARQRYVTEGLGPVMETMAARGDYQAAHRIVIGPLQETYEEANTQVDSLIAHIQREAELTRAAMVAEHQRDERHLYATLGLTVLGLILAGVLFFRGIMRPLENSIDALEGMARGNLSRHPEVRGHGETRRLTHALAISQAQLHAILDQLAQNAASLSAESALLNRQVRRIADGTDEQHERVHLMADKVSESTEAMARLSDQAERMTGNAEHAMTVLAMAEQDVTDMLGRMHGLTDTVQRLREQAGTIIASCRLGLEQPAAAEPLEDSRQALVVGIQQNLKRIGVCLGNMSERIDAEQPTLAGLDSIHSGSWTTLKEISAELGAMARELAIAARLQTFAAEDIQADMRIIADFLVSNREAGHQIWSASSQVLELATALEDLIGNFSLAAPATSAQRRAAWPRAETAD